MRQILLLATIMTLTVGGIAQAQGKWEKAAPFPEPGEELYGVAANGKMFVIGGFGPGGRPIGMAWEYDPVGDSWTKRKTMPVPVHHGALASYNGKIYVFGGFTLYEVPGQGAGGWQPTDNVWEFDPVADSWTARAPMLTKRGSPIAVEVGGKIYVIGGAATVPGSKEPALFPNRPSRSISTNDVYDPASDKWEVRAPMPTPRNHMFAGAVNGKIYAIGGRVASPYMSVASNLDIVEEYDPAADQWGPQKARMPTPRSGGAFATYEGRIYAAGGEVQTPQMLGAFRALEAYEPATNSWTVLPAMPTPRHGVAGAFLGNRLHLVSGRITSGGYEPGLVLSTAAHDVFEVPTN